VVLLSDDESGERDAGADADEDADESEQSPDPAAERIEDENASGGASGFLGNIKGARKQLGDAKDAFSNARGAGTLPTDEDGKVRIVCRRYDERRLAPLDDLGRPSCYEAGNEDCESCVDAVSDGTVETW
jgi:hypothetical protein